tara:strand:+ start:2617 stop:3222 length:606 start_codon:yes stop_codon:yes gene_type:complete
MRLLIFILLLLFTFSFSETKNYNPKKYIIQSAFFPGLGEYKMGEIKRSKKFIFIESGLILLAIETHLRNQRNIKQINSFSVNHAGVNISNKSEKFILDISNHLSTNLYNQNQQRLRNSTDIYTNENYQWEWDNISNMQKFNSLVSNKNKLNKLLLFTFGSMVSNRILSIINVNYLNNLNKLKLSFIPIYNEESSLQLILNF